MKPATLHQRRAEWAERRMGIRRGVVKVLRSIEAGEVDELDLAKLHNFCQCALALLAKVEQPVWESAKKSAELASLLRGEMVDFDYAVKTLEDVGVVDDDEDSEGSRGHKHVNEWEDS
jgi:hypothetical protein